MTTQSPSRLKDLVVTAAVASVVSALVGPMLRRWVEGTPRLPTDNPEDLDNEPSTFPTADAAPFDDDYEDRVQRLFEFSPGAIPTDAVMAFANPDFSPEET